MNRADKMLSVLQDGKPHSRRDLFDRIGFFLTNNAASELRAQGHDVRQHRKRVDGVTVYSYQWFGSLSEGDAGEGNDHEALASVALTADNATSPSLSEWPGCACGSSEYRHVTDDVFRCNGCNAQVDPRPRQMTLEGAA